jgi:hypothetical protein
MTPRGRRRDYPVLISKLMTNKAAMAGGDSIEERETSMPKGLGDSDTIVKENHGVQRHSSNVGESR